MKLTSFTSSSKYCLINLNFNPLDLKKLRHDYFSISIYLEKQNIQHQLMFCAKSYKHKREFTKF